MTESLQLLQQVIEETLRREGAGGMDPLNSVPLGLNGELTYTQFKKAVSDGRLNGAQLRTKETSITAATHTLYGCTGLFGLCGPDEIIGLTMGDDQLISWLGFNEDRVCERFIKGLTYIDQEGTAAGSVVGNVYGAPCDNPPTSEKGTCEFAIGDFGNYHGCGEGVDVTKIGVRKCDKQPTYTLPIEGVGNVRIDNDLDLEVIAATQMTKHQISRDVITGSKAAAYQMDGLENVVKVGYTSVDGERCYALDSWVLDWANDDMSGAVNGYGSIVGAVREMWRNILWRIKQSKLGQVREGDAVLVMPYWMAREFLDEWAWWSIRTGQQYNEVFRDNLALRKFRNEFDQGMFNGGHINIDGFNIHIIEHDWMTISQDAPSFCSDIYLLVRAIGGRKTFQGQYIPSNLGADAVAAAGGGQYFSMEAIQAGRGLKWLKFDNACVKPCVNFRPRLYPEAPWSLGKIENICIAAGNFNPMSVDPQSSYFIEQNPVAAQSITQYWYDDEGWFH